MEKIQICPVCSGQSFQDHIHCKDFTVSKAVFTIQKCKTCGFLFTNPRPAQAEIGLYYESKDYISHTNSKKGLFNKTYQLIRDIAIANKIGLIRKETGKRSFAADFSLLDIGCGTGEFLAGSKSQGWKSVGVEPGESARQQAIKNHGVQVEEESYLNSSKEEFDVITMWHVLEHVHDLNGRLEQIYRLLKKNGVLIIAVPNHTSKDAAIYGEKWAAWDVPRHLYHFSPEVIKLLLKRHHFTHITSSPMKYDAFYVSLLSTGYESGKKSTIKGALAGLRSNLAAKGNPEKYSSVIYTFRKED